MLLECEAYHAARSESLRSWNLDRQAPRREVQWLVHLLSRERLVALEEDEEQDGPGGGGNAPPIRSDSD